MQKVYLKRARGASFVRGVLSGEPDPRGIERDNSFGKRERGTLWKGQAARGSEADEEKRRTSERRRWKEGGGR